MRDCSEAQNDVATRRVVDGGAPAIAIKELARHASIAVTNRYMRLAPGGAARNAIALARNCATAPKN